MGIHCESVQVESVLSAVFLTYCAHACKKYLFLLLIIIYNSVHKPLTGLTFVEMIIRVCMYVDMIIRVCNVHVCREVSNSSYICIKVFKIKKCTCMCIY